MGADQGHSMTGGEEDWNSWRYRQLGSLRRHCAVHVSDTPPDAISDRNTSSTTLLEVVTSDLARLSELFKEVTKMQDRFKQLKDWEQDETREDGRPSTLLTDAVSAHPLSDSDGRFEISSSATPSPHHHPCTTLPTPPASTSPSPASTPMQHPDLPSHGNSSRRSNKSGRSRGSSDKNSGSSKSNRTTVTRPNYHERRSSPTNSQHTSSSGGTATQSGADADRVSSEERRRERREVERLRRRHMAQRIGRDVHAARTLYDKKRRDAIEVQRQDAQMRSGGSNTSVGSAKSQTSETTYYTAPATSGGGDDGSKTPNPSSSRTTSFEFRNPNSMERPTGATEDVYKRAWVRYVTEWDEVLKQPPSPSRELYTFHTFPWPTLNPPTDVKGLNKATIRNFIQRAHHAGVASRHAAAGPSGGMGAGAAMNTPQETKDAMHEARLRWHPDRSARWMVHVSDEEKARVKKGADIVIRVLNDLSEEEHVGRSGCYGPVFA
ncbi:hypothetical protein FRB94_003730 [Tulasnella sp. JGI-2019a]|nr:hypothetical protein FRB93_013410 [Tulasnella sp. JGI-2019a]KAG9002637.1 hypothetical protein FRB94_003730 [Tulasnella sp. JGI-2019a]KAG9026995.1 hypothetical protein FRB95_008226 [Tulasnella sp. JGI-2019a]